MATTNLDGTDADFLYTPQGGSATTHLLAVKLLVSPSHGWRSAHKRRRFEAWSADFGSREVFTVGTAVDQITAQIRYDDQPSSLRSMLTEGLENDVTLTYRPTGSGGSTFPSKLVSVGGGEPGEVVLTPDQDRFGLGEHQATIVLRRVDGNDYEALL